MITIVTDSSSYFKESEAEGLGLRVVRLNYTVNGQVRIESFGDQNGNFEDVLNSSGKFTTSHPNMDAFMSCFEEELKNGNEVLCITMSSRLSGCYSTAHIAAKQIESDKIAVFDSQLTTGGLYLIVKEAKKLVENGLSLDEILTELMDIRRRITIAFSVDDMEPLRKSGRMGFVRMSVSTFLNIKPILLMKDGAVVSDSMARGSSEIIKKLSEKVTADTQEVVINYIGDTRMATNLYHIIKKAAPQAEVSLQKIGPVLGIHLGLKVIGVSFLGK